MQSGIHSEATAGWEHTALGTMMALLTGLDPFDVSSPSGAEYAPRRGVTLGKAVAVIP